MSDRPNPFESPPAAASDATPASLFSLADSPRMAIVAASAALFLVACCLPALTVAVRHDIPIEGPDIPKPETHLGLGLLLFGCFAVFNGQFGWLANVLWLVGGVLLLFGRHAAAAIVGGIALAVALLTLTMYRSELWSYPGYLLRLTSLDPGFYVWFVSLAIVPLGSAWLAWNQRAIPATLAEPTP